MIKGASTVDDALAVVASPEDEAVAVTASTADDAVAMIAPTADKVVAMVASTTDEAVAEGAGTPRSRLLARQCQCSKFVFPDLAVNNLSLLSRRLQNRTHRQHSADTTQPSRLAFPAFRV